MILMILRALDFDISPKKFYSGSLQQAVTNVIETIGNCQPVFLVLVKRKK